MRGLVSRDDERHDLEKASLAQEQPVRSWGLLHLESELP